VRDFFNDPVGFKEGQTSKKEAALDRSAKSTSRSMSLAKITESQRLLDPAQNE